jgi:hypothetical protein
VYGDAVVWSETCNTNVAHAVRHGSIGWTAADATLTVRFRRGTAFRYFTVPRAIVEAMLAAPSKGACFTRHIWHAFPFIQIVEHPSRS